MPDTKLRIVACDDQAHITCMLDMTLRRLGFDVETYPTGDLALEAIQRATPSLLITDCQMPPGISGLDLCRRIRRNPQWDQMPIVMLTSKGYEMSPEILKRDLMIAAVLDKPFSPRQLSRLVETLTVSMSEDVAAELSAAGLPEPCPVANH